jgi:hypothetical protein
VGSKCHSTPRQAVELTWATVQQLGTVVHHTFNIVRSMHRRQVHTQPDSSPVPAQVHLCPRPHSHDEYLCSTSKIQTCIVVKAQCAHGCGHAGQDHMRCLHVPLLPRVPTMMNISQARRPRDVGKKIGSTLQPVYQLASPVGAAQQLWAGWPMCNACLFSHDVTLPYTSRMEKVLRASAGCLR